MKRKFLLISSVICVLALFWLVIIPKIFDLLKPKFVAHFEKNYNYTIVDENFSLATGFSPYFNIKADNLEILNPNKKSIIRINHPSLKISFLPLLIGRINIHSAMVENIDANLYLDEPILNNTDFVTRVRKIALNANNANIEAFNILLAKTPQEQGFTLNGKNCSFKNANKTKNLKLNAKILNGNKSAQINTDFYLPQKTSKIFSQSSISIKNLDIAHFITTFDKYLPASINTASGVLNLELKNEKLSANLENVQLIDKELSKSIVFPQKINIAGDINLSEEEIKIFGLNMQGNGLNIDTNTNIKKHKNNAPFIDISLGIKDTKTEALLKMLPAITTPDINLFELKKNPLFGVANGEIKINGKLPEPAIEGGVLIKNAYLITPVQNDKSSPFIKITFENGDVGYEAIVGLGGAEGVSVNGRSALYGEKFSKITIKSTKNCNLAVAKKIVNPLEKIFNFQAGPLSIMNLSGNGNIDFNLEGTKACPYAWGKMNFSNATASFIDIKGLILKNASGYINFNKQDVDFKITDGYVDNQKFKLEGKCNLYGKMDINVALKEFSAQKGINIVNYSPILKELQSFIPPISTLNGTLDMDLNITGQVPSVEDVEFNKNLFVKGNLKLNNINVGIDEFTLSNVNGNVDFDGTNANIDALSQINNSKILINGGIKNNIADITIKSDKLNLRDLLHNTELKDLVDNNFIKFYCNYKGRTDIIEPEKLIMEAKVIGANENSQILINSGDLNIKNGICLIKNISGQISQNPFNMNAKIQNLGKKNQNINANIHLNNAALSTINVIREFYLIPNETKALLRKLDFNTGKTDIDIKVVNNRPYGNLSLNDVSITYLPLNMPLKIINGQIQLRNDLLSFNKINTLADDMPIFIDGEVRNIYKKPYHDVYINSVPKQSFIDKYLNKNSTYPLKIKGDIIYSAKIKGVMDLYNISANAKIGERANLYYLGATLGDNENPTIIEFDGDIVKNNSVKINNFEYNKSVLSQNNRSTLINFLKVNGLVKLINNEPYFQNLLVKTENPTDAKIFNVIFKKPNIKQGLFTSDLKINGKLSDLKILGDFNIFDINAPLLQTVIKDVSLKFTPNEIKINSTGEIFSNEIKLIADAENKLRPPYRIKNGTVHFDKLDINSAITDFNKLEINKPRQKDDKQDIDLTTLIIERLNLDANDVLIKGIAAKNLTTLITLSDKMKLSLANYNLEIANGQIAGDASYNLLSHRADLLLNAENIDANELSVMLFNLPNQMYGNLTGTVNLNCNGSSDKACFSTLNGSGSFNVSNGRVPKLGSLEYLLKASNLIKNGITGVSINSLIDIITPLKTGEFSNIYGTLHIQEGIADDIKISTRGKDLSLYIKGAYNFSSSDAQMYVFGILSKNIKTPLGAIGNASLNTLFNLIPGVNLEEHSPFVTDINKIPGIELSQKAFRKFIAEIRGDINGDNYVKSFKWIN